MPSHGRTRMQSACAGSRKTDPISIVLNIRIPNPGSLNRRCHGSPHAQAGLPSANGMRQPVLQENLLKASVAFSKIRPTAEPLFNPANLGLGFL